VASRIRLVVVEEICRDRSSSPKQPEVQSGNQAQYIFVFWRRELCRLPTAVSFTLPLVVVQVGTFQLI